MRLFWSSSHCLSLVLVGGLITGEPRALAAPTASALGRQLLRDNRYLARRNPAALLAKFELMAGSAFIYYRAAAGRSYALAQQLGQLEWAGGHPKVLANLDPHINGNVGGVKAREWRLIDQDESGYLAPFSVDLVRWGAGVFLASQEQRLAPAAAAAVVIHMAQSYAKALDGFPVTKEPPKRIRELLRDAAQGADARRKAKLDRQGRFRADGKNRALASGERGELSVAYQRYLSSLGVTQRQQLEGYAIVDGVARTSGGGSRGLARYRLVLVPKGEEAQARAKALVLEFKDQPPSPAQRLFGKSPLRVRSEAERVIAMRRRQGSASEFDGYTTMRRRGSFSVLEVRFDEAEFDPLKLGSGAWRDDIAKADGRALAFAHTQSAWNESAEVLVRRLRATIQSQGDAGNATGSDAFAQAIAREAQRLATAFAAEWGVYRGSAQRPGAHDWLKRALQAPGQ